MSEPLSSAAGLAFHATEALPDIGSDTTRRLPRSRNGQEVYQNQLQPRKKSVSHPLDATAITKPSHCVAGPFELSAKRTTKPTSSSTASSRTASDEARLQAVTSPSEVSSRHHGSTSTDPSSVERPDFESGQDGLRSKQSVYAHLANIATGARNSSQVTGPSHTQAYSAGAALQSAGLAQFQASTSQVMSKPLLNVLSHATFLDALENPPVRHRLHKYSETSLCSKYMPFLDQIRYHRKTVLEATKAMAELDAKFLSPQSESHIDLSQPAHDDLRSDIKTVMDEAYPSLSDIFNDAEDAVQSAIYTAIYPDFVRAQMTLSASEALSGDRHRYQGLGDCFCLTEPSKADNPITYASDGFVAVTGYQRADIIPRNCRFLQGKQTDLAAVRRVKHCIQTTQESVEFLLNYRKNGEPFWNLLYTAPLLDSDGRVAFFIGGQVNCSSSIHGRPDIMKVLATSAEHDSEEFNVKTPATDLVRRVDRLKALKYRMKANVALEPGAERQLIENNQTVESSTRIERFYNAYSKYLVVRYPSLDIDFSSASIHTFLNDTLSTKSPVIGSNVFKFLKAKMLGKDKSDWKHRIEVALRAGRPISVALRLQTKRSAMFRGDENFLTHWTPLKDVDSRVHWVVVCLCPAME